MLRMFGELVGPLLSLASRKIQESGTLAAQRDTLLPGLVSGDVRVRAAKGFVDTVSP